MKKSEINKLDKISGAKCRSLGYCEKCGSTSWLQWCHIKSRKFQIIRWNPINHLCLCAKCHRWGHDEPDAFTRWIIEYRGQGDLDELDRLRWSIGPKLFYEDVLKQLEGK